MSSSVAAGRLRPFLLLALLIVIAYGGALQNGFVFDDAIFLSQDSRLATPAGLARTFVEPLWGFADPPGVDGIHQYYRPLQLLPLGISKIWLDTAAWPAHLLSLVLHWANACLVFTLLRSLAGHGGAALLLAAVFALHPANSEAVLWLSDVAGLGASFCLLAMLLLHRRRYGRGPNASTAAQVISALGSLLVSVLYLAGMWFKESGVLAPVVLVLHDVLVRRTEPFNLTWRDLLDYLAMVPSLAVYFVLRHAALGGLLPGADRLELGGVELAINAVALLPQYAATYLWPFDLNMFHDFEAVSGMTDPRFIVGGAMVVGAAVIALAGIRARPLVTFGVAFAAVTVAPYLVARWPQLNVFAERYLYLPSVGLYSALASTVGVLLARARSGRLLVAATVAILACFVVVDIDRSRDWRDDITIYEDTLAHGGRADLIRNNLALAYREAGRTAEALWLLEGLLERRPDFARGWHNLGLVLLDLERPADAVDAFSRAAKLDPGNAASALNLGYAYERVGQRDAAVEWYFRAVALDPEEAKPWYNLAVIALEEQQYGNARMAAERAVAHDPDDHEAVDLRKRVAARASDAQTRQPPRTATLARCEGGRQAMEAGKPVIAAAKLRAAAWLDEGAALPHHYLANVFYLQGRHALALRHERAAAKRAPENELFRRNLESLRELLAGQQGRAPEF